MVVRGGMGGCWSGPLGLFPTDHSCMTIDRRMLLTKEITNQRSFSFMFIVVVRL